MTDFFIHDRAEPDDIEAWDIGERAGQLPPEELPINFYDNEDGFWDEFIQNKLNRSYDAGILVNRKYFHH